MIILFVIAAVLLFGMVRFGKRMFNALDDLNGGAEIRRKNPVLWKAMWLPIRVLGFLIFTLVLAGMGPIGWLLWLAVIMSILMHFVNRWREFTGRRRWNRQTAIWALKRSLVRRSVEAAIETSGLTQLRDGKVVKPIVLDVQEVSRPDGRPYGHTIRIMSATGGGSLKSIIDLIGKDPYSDAWTSEVRSHMAHLAGYRQDMRTRMLMAPVRHPGTRWLDRQGQLPRPMRSKMSRTEEHEAGEGDLTIVYDDPLKDFLPYPYRPGWWAYHFASTMDARPLGRWDDGTEILMKLNEKRVLNQGAPGSGKSSWMDAAIAFDIECYDCFTVYADLKGGMQGRPWEQGVGIFVSRPDEVARLFEHLYKVMIHLTERATTSKKIQGTPLDPFLRMYCDEVSEFPAALLEKRDVTLLDGSKKEGVIIAEDILRLSRGIGWDSWWATQHATSERFPRGALVSLDTRISTRVTDRPAAEVAVPSRTAAASPDTIPDTPAYKGAAVLAEMESGVVRMGKGYFASDDAEREERAKLASLRTFKPQDVWGLRDAAFKGRRSFAVGAPQPVEVTPLHQDSAWPPQSLVADVWAALDVVADASSGKRVGAIRAEQILSDSMYSTAVKRARANWSRGKGSSEALAAKLAEAIQTIKESDGLTIAREHPRPVHSTVG